MTDSQEEPGVDWKDELTRARLDPDHQSETFLTTLARIYDSGVPEAEITAHLKNTPQRVAEWVAMGHALLQHIADGKLGWSPYHMAQRYSRGEITRDQLMHGLTEWEYVPTQLETKDLGPGEDLIVSVPGSFDDVEAARSDRLIDGETYTAVLKAYKPPRVVRRPSDGG